MNETPLSNPIEVNGSKAFFEAFALLKERGLRVTSMDVNCKSKKWPWKDRSPARCMIYWTVDQEQKILALKI